MDGTRLARRYLPLAVVVALQAVIIAVVPSTAPRSASAAGGVDYSQAGAAAAGGGYGIAGGAASGSAATAAGGATGSAGSTAAGAPGSAAGGAHSAAGAATTAAGDTKHCVDGRQFDPKIDYYAPPCTPTFSGNNGGATYQGVTKDKVEVVWYYGDAGAEVDQILKAEGLYVTYDQYKAYNAAVEKFVNSHYELYGRKMHIDTYRGTCTTVPPDHQCLNAEMDKIVATYHPYAVMWQTTLCSDCFAELSRKGVVNLGGSGFSEAFAQAMAPFHWDTAMTGTMMANAFGEFWCKQMTSVNSSRKVAFAGHQNPAQDFNGKKRVLGVISTNDPDNMYTVEKVLKPALAKCGDKITNQYYYDQNINTAAQQVQAGIAKMDPPNNPSTTVLCLCDPVAPAFLYEGEQNNNYYPENVIASDQSMDTDKTGQSYTQPNSLACPTPSKGCEYDHAFGLSELDSGEPLNNDVGTRIWHLGGGQGNTQFPSDTAGTVWEYYNMLATMIEATGPNLTPQNMAAAAYRIPPRGGGATGHYQVSLSPQNHGWISDVRIVYWDKTRTSPVNGQPGSYVQIEGSRKGPGQFATMQEPPVVMKGN